MASSWRRRLRRLSPGRDPRGRGSRRVCLTGEFGEDSDLTPSANASARAEGPAKRLVLLGATGSIGKSCARVILDNPGRFRVEAVVGGRDGAALARTAIELGAKFAA